MNGHMVRKIWILLWFLTPASALGQYAITPDPQAKAGLSQVPMVLEPADADAFRDIVESTIPPRYNTAIIRWYTGLLDRQRAKQAELARESKPKNQPEQKEQ